MILEQSNIETFNHLCLFFFKSLTEITYSYIAYFTFMFTRSNKTDYITMLPNSFHCLKFRLKISSVFNASVTFVYKYNIYIYISEENPQ